MRGFDPDALVVARAKHARALVAKGVWESDMARVAIGGAKRAVISMGVDGLNAVPREQTLVIRGKF